MIKIFRSPKELKEFNDNKENLPVQVCLLLVYYYKGKFSIKYTMIPSVELKSYRFILDWEINLRKK